MHNSGYDAFRAFRARARRMPPTKQHRAALWENMLGTVYAMNRAGEVKYFDYDYDKALAHIGAVDDVRVATYKPYVTRLGAHVQDNDYQLPRVGQAVWFVIDATAEQEVPHA